MGLGKTIQTMTFLEQLSTLKATQVRGPFLVVAPLTLVAQWQSEAMAWAPVCYPHVSYVFLKVSYLMAHELL